MKWKRKLTTELEGFCIPKIWQILKAFYWNIFIKHKTLISEEWHIKADEKEGRGWILKAFFDLFNGDFQIVLLVFGGRFFGLFDLASDVADLWIRCRSGAKFTKEKTSV